MLVLEERGKPEYPEKNLSEQRREPTIDSTHIWRRRRDLNPGLNDGRRVLSPLRYHWLPIYQERSENSPVHSLKYKWTTSLNFLVINVALHNEMTVVGVRTQELWVNECFVWRLAVEHHVHPLSKRKIVLLSSSYLSTINYEKARGIPGS